MKAPAARVRFTQLSQVLKNGTITGTPGTPVQGSPDKIVETLKKRKRVTEDSDEDINSDEGINSEGGISSDEDINSDGDISSDEDISAGQKGSIIHPSAGSGSLSGYTTIDGIDIELVKSNKYWNIPRRPKIPKTESSPAMDSESTGSDNSHAIIDGVDDDLEIPATESVSMGSDNGHAIIDSVDDDLESSATDSVSMGSDNGHATIDGVDDDLVEANISWNVPKGSKIPEKESSPATDSTSMGLDRDEPPKCAPPKWGYYDDLYSKIYDLSQPIFEHTVTSSEIRGRGPTAEPRILDRYIDKRHSRTLPVLTNLNFQLPVIKADEGPNSIFYPGKQFNKWSPAVFDFRFRGSFPEAETNELYEKHVLPFA